MIASSISCDEEGLVGLRNDDRPDSLRSKTVGKPIPPAGPKVADFSEVSICGDDVECFSALLCASAGTDGLWGTSSVVRPASSLVLVFKLSWLGFLFMAGILGLINEGDDGSDTSVEEVVEPANGGWMDRPFMFLGRRGVGDVIGRIKRCPDSDTDRLAMEGKAPKEVPGNALRGTRFTGESGEEEGDGSESEEESVHETVVVGDESADSDACMDAIS